MGGLSFTLGVIEAVAWPIALATILYAFRKEIRTLGTMVRRLKIGQLEAELECVRDESKKTIEELRKFAILLAKLNGANLPGAISGPHSVRLRFLPTNEKFLYAKQMVESLIALGVDERHARTVAWNPLIDAIRDGHKTWIKAETNRICDAGKSRGSLFIKDVDTPSIDDYIQGRIGFGEMESRLAESLPQVTEELEERLLDLKYFDAKKELRRPDVKPWAEQD
jgi:hypothetical protein